MSDELSNVPRRLRRYYRHGEPLPIQEMEPKNVEKSFPSIPSNEKMEEKEPWMNTKQTFSSDASTPPSSSRSRRNERRENARENISSSTSPPTPFSSPSMDIPKQGLFGRILNQSKKPSVTPMDHALGLNEKKLFEEKPPQASEQALHQNPPPSNIPLPKSVQAQNEIQSALQELRSLAKNDSPAPASPSPLTKPSTTPLTSFHFTPAGEAPHLPLEGEKQSSQSQSSSAPPNLSPRERAEQRKNMRGGNASAGATPIPTSPNTSPTSPSSTAPSNIPAHIRRRMGRVESGNENDSLEESRTANDNTPAPSTGVDEDFKSLFGEPKKKDAKKKKEKSEDEGEFSMDENEEDGLELFEDEK